MADDLLSFPISPEYCADWTSERAVSELVANALDEDPETELRFEDGQIIIEDQGPGLPRQGLLIGISRDSRSGRRKRDDQIGRFGEGLNIGALVLARNKIPMKVETAGYGFVPRIGHDQRFDTDVLQLAFEDSRRSRGTKISVRAPRRLFDKVRRRFLHFNDDYQPPTGSGRIVAGETGRIYLGGVFITEKKDLCFSYDLALCETTKGLLNRDRTTLDAWELQGALRNIVLEIQDPAVAKLWLAAALEGRLSRVERYDSYQQTPAFARLMREVAPEVLDAEIANCFYLLDDDEEVSLDLKDNGYLLLVPAGDRGEFQLLMRLLGVEQARVKARRRLDESNDPTLTDWVSGDLNDDEAANLERAVALGRAAWGETAIDKVRIFERHSPDGSRGVYGEGHAWGVSEWLGFYNPRQDLIALRRDQLSSLKSTLELLIHETAHRVAYKTHGDWHDRSRGFERTLGDLGAALALSASGLEMAPLISSEESAALPEQEILAEVVRRSQARGLDSAKKLAQACGISVSAATRLRQTSRPSPGQRRASLPSKQIIEAVADEVDLPWEAVWLSLWSSRVLTTSRRRDGRLWGQMNKQYREARAWLDAAAERDEAFLELMAIFDALADGSWPELKTINIANGIPDDAEFYASFHRLNRLTIQHYPLS